MNKIFYKEFIIPKRIKFKKINNKLIYRVIIKKSLINILILAISLLKLDDMINAINIFLLLL